MKMTSRLHAAELAIGRICDRERESVANVFDRIEELTLIFVDHPPTFSPAIEAGIHAAVDRELRSQCEPG
ncbi:MAG: hypothetical protein K8U57_04355 [Planctomycetes bacterium]|nr:hypothetical protein [Planctomycetota bacterium]